MLMQSWEVRSCGFFGFGRVAKYEGAPTTAMQKSGPMHGDHVLRYLLAETNAGVVALCDDIGQAIFSDALDLDIRVARQQPRQGRPEHRFGPVFARPNAHPTSSLPPPPRPTLTVRTSL